jgi:hypothetical protein
MTVQATDPLEKLIHDAGEDWLMESREPPGKTLQFLRSLLGEASSLASKRWGPSAPRIDVDSMLREQERNPHKVQAFLQALGSTESPEMLVMVWRILEGRGVERIELQYELQNSFSLQITLQSDRGEPEETYKSNNIYDAALLRHFGIMTMDNLPIFDGFYPLESGERHG